MKKNAYAFGQIKSGQKIYPPDLVFAPTLACWRVRKRVALTTASLGTAGRTYT